MIVKKIKQPISDVDKEFEEKKTHSLLVESIVDENNEDIFTTRLSTFDHINGTEDAKDEDVMKMFLALCVMLIGDPKYSNFSEHSKAIINAALDKFDEISHSARPLDSTTKH
jgi:hypothetical protein